MQTWADVGNSILVFVPFQEPNRQPSPICNRLRLIRAPPTWQPCDLLPKVCGHAATFPARTTYPTGHVKICVSRMSVPKRFKDPAHRQIPEDCPCGKKLWHHRQARRGLRAHVAHHIASGHIPPDSCGWCGKSPPCNVDLHKSNYGEKATLVPTSTNCPRFYKFRYADAQKATNAKEQPKELKRLCTNVPIKCRKCEDSPRSSLQR